ncbi:hypothetical protein CRUP_021355 [Coryphaenoides rupestris]|nr:hypothetical protein CRUP_021355 [Coryphaenoides rupestris]
MAPKDALLATLKVCILNLQSDGGDVVTESSAHLASCCELLEFILRDGLQLLSLVHRDYWHCFELVPQQDTCGSNTALSLAVEQTRVCKKLLGAQGRGRYFLRLALSRKVLQSFIRHLLHTPRVLEVCEIYETVPCRELGMVLRYLRGRVFVLEMLPGSQAQVDRFLSPGDIIDEINGVSLRNSRIGQASLVLSRLKGLPLSLRVLRWRDRGGASYRPLIHLLRELRTENPALALGLEAAPSPHAAQPPSSSSFTPCFKDGRMVYVLQYLGKANIGLYGGKEVLQNAIPQVLHRNLPIKEVFFDMKETHLICIEKSTNKELFQHHYPEISCVGRFAQPDYTIFAFCVADSPETHLVTGFCCVVLRTSSQAECEELVCRIATGFKHTEWFV